MKVKPKLYLNGSPQTAEEGSLAFARNMKIDNDGNLVSDYGYENIESLQDYNIVGHIVGLDNKIYLFTDKEEQINTEDVDVYKTINIILEYDEIDKTVNELATGWSYSNGEISGYVSTNITGEKILTIAEYKEYANIPLKHINLAHCSKTDDESLYCQAPICPTANLMLKDTYVKTIPNGVYIFFIRYKIRKDVYTNWFLCSRPIYSGCSEKITTFQGGLEYINLHKDSAKSFIFDLIFAQEENKQSYKEFQLGFIITHDEATDARTWKHFDINTKTIYFDYENVEEANIDDLLKVTYELYNVKNVTAFKNKLYISNYKETNFNYDVNLDNIIDLKVVDNYDSSESSVPKANLSGFDLVYNVDIFDKTTTGLTVSQILSKNNFDYNINVLDKNGTKIADAKSIASFTLEWDSSSNPDIAFITKVTNTLYNNCIFGKAFNNVYPNNNTNNSLLSTFGIKFTGENNDFYSYEPIDTTSIIPSSLNNSLYNLGFSFAFGSRYNSGQDSQNYYLEDQAFNTYSFYKLRSMNFYAMNLGFGDKGVESIKNVVKEEIESRSFFAKAYIIISSAGNIYKIGYKDIMDSSTYAGNNMDFNILTLEGFTFSTITCVEDYKENPYKYYKDDDLEILNPNYFNVDSLDENLKTNIIQWLFNTIQPITKGISVTDTGNHLMLDLSKYGGNTKVVVDNIQIVFKKIDFEVEIEESNFESNKKFKYNFDIKMTSKDYIYNCNFTFNDTLMSKAADRIYSQIPSLMPFSKYRIYVHFVDNHNIITNGIKLKDIPTKGVENNNSILSLAYKLNKDYNNYYKSFFISIKNIGDIIIEGFGYKKLDNTHILNFLELDTLLYNINDNITIIDNTGNIITDTAKYYSSGSSSPSLAFGNCGYVSWINDKDGNKDNNDHSKETLYIKITRNIDNISEHNLVKASGYIPLIKTNDYVNLIDAYYGSWFCSVTKPDFDLSSSCYVSGRDIYTADRTTDYITLKDFENYITISPSKEYYIRSNFNLNYLSLTEDITDTIFSIGSASTGNKQVAKILNSATLSYIYELKSMYKDFMNKTFNAYDKDYKIEFDNTIRVSNVLSDETFNNSVFKFDATDYYNIPTDRGVIVSLFAIGNTIYAHTKGSLYKFDATQTIMSTNEDIKLQESEPFEIGLSQVFDSQYGYGGIENKEAGCITFDSYFFYDNKSNHIFAYSGNSQVQLIDGTIYKLLEYYKPNICRTIHDITNKRILFEFELPVFEGTKNPIITLSYNYKSKSFVSIHDITLKNSFTTINTVYSYNKEFIKLFDTTYKTIPQDILFKPFNLYKLYGSASKRSYLIFDNLDKSPFNIAVIMFPKNYLKEVLNNVSYIGNIIENDIISYSGRDEIGLRYSYNQINVLVTKPETIVKAFNIITDICKSNIIRDTIDDTIRPNSLLDYKGIKYDKGNWNINYFRDNQNRRDIYNYNDVESDNLSLIYGKFFILNFNFINEKPIKFEEIFINLEKY